jgi:2-polyprenyl-6-methoxyphenol hydroxylase-like FAD-dependent oxidoreductase
LIRKKANKEQGTGAAIVGSYVLAGEISKSPNNIPLALSNYERIARQYIDKAQKLGSLHHCS